MSRITESRSNQNRDTLTVYSIMVICSSYPPVLGGTEIEVQRVCSALARQGHHVRVLCVGGAPMPSARNWTDPAGVSVRLFGAWCPARWRHYAYAAGVAWTLFRERRFCQIAYFVMGGVQLATGLPVARVLGKRIVMKFSGSHTIAPLARTPLGRLELRFLSRWASRILVLNPAMMEEAAGVGLRAEQLAWMPNPVDIEEFCPVDRARRGILRQSRNLPEDAPVILFVGRLAPEKELPTLLEAVALLRRRCPEVRLALVGDGPMRSELECKAALLGLSESVHFAGAVPPEAVSGWLQTADVFALTSSLEGFPCALVEAMAVGLAAVVSDIAANRQLIEDGVHGYIARCGDPEATAEALRRLVENPDRQKEFGAAGRRRVVDHYSTARVVDRYESLFGEIIGESGLRKPAEVTPKQRTSRPVT